MQWAASDHDTTCGHRKDVTLFQKGQMIGLREANETTEIVKTTTIGLKTAQRIIRTQTGECWNIIFRGKNVIGRKPRMIASSSNRT